MAEQIQGKITQIIGAVLDIKFPEGKLPKIYDAMHIAAPDGGVLTAEVAQHLGDDTVRCIAMGPTDGLVRGAEAIATGAPITVPVGEKTLGRIFNVTGDAIDKKPAPEGVEYLPITAFQIRRVAYQKVCNCLTAGCMCIQDGDICSHCTADT